MGRVALLDLTLPQVSLCRYYFAVYYIIRISLVLLAEHLEQAMSFLVIGAVKTEPLSAEAIFVWKNLFCNIW